MASTISFGRRTETRLTLSPGTGRHPVLRASSPALVFPVAVGSRLIFTTFVPCTVNYQAFIATWEFGGTGGSTIDLNCTSDPTTVNCIPEDEYLTNFAGFFFSEINDVVTFIPGTYTAAPDVPSDPGATLTITPTPEPSTLVLLLSAGLALVVFSRLHG